MKTALLLQFAFLFFVPIGSFAAVPTFTDIPMDYRTKEIPLERPLLLEFVYGTGANDVINLSVVNYPGKKSDLFFFHMHNDEITSKRATENAVRKNGGTFMSMTHKGEGDKREMHIKLDNVNYTLDPNRIFTDRALQESTSPNPSPAHFAILKKMVNWVTRNILLALENRKQRLAIATHNNTDDDRYGKALSILTEKNLIGKDNREVYQNPLWDIDNFYIATMKSTYDSLITRFKPNISLRMEHPRDIGYLSNWMIQQKIDYINVECQHDDDAGNASMIEKLQE